MELLLLLVELLKGLLGLRLVGLLDSQHRERSVVQAVIATRVERDELVMEGSTMNRGHTGGLLVCDKCSIRQRKDL